jgi:tRNA nucleotidyltransferase/poly(A) polymerase
MLKEAGFSAYFVGGSVRDLLLGKHPKDFDIATNATPHQIKRIIPQGRIIGRRFRHVMLEKGGGRYEIVTFRGPVVQAEEEIAELDDENLEDQPLQENSAKRNPENPGDRGRERRYPDLNQFGNAEQDALRRDFTINALFYDPDADELVDYVEGKLDIDRKIIRSIGDPQVRMEEDPIRILRAIRHKMKLGLDYDPALENAMRERAPLLLETSKDRIREEFLKVCNDHSLGDFLEEGRRIGLAPYTMPWLESISDESWNDSIRLLAAFKEAPLPERLSPDMGLALMMIPLVKPLVLDPYQETLQPGDKNHLPDMKYFLSCEPLRNFYLRNLRISRAQTDHLVRALFYFSRMTGLWLEQGPPRRIIGRLFQHPPAVLAARMSRLSLHAEEKEIPHWLAELADYEHGKRRHTGRDNQAGGRDNRRGRQTDRVMDETEEGSFAEEPGREAPEESQETRESSKTHRLPPPDEPMVWNGPLHAPVLRPVFAEEPTIRWSRKNQTVRAFRPSGIPNQPVDYSLRKSSLVYNYKPELESTGSREDERSDRSGERGRRRDRGDRRRGRERGERNRGRGREPREPREASAAAPASGPEHSGNTRPPMDEDSIGNIRMPGEPPAPLEYMAGNQQSYESDDLDDNIGNRLDAPPTSGYVAATGEGMLTHHRQPGNNRRGGQASESGNRRRRGKKRGRRGGGGQNRGSGGNSRGNFNVQ